jgi:transcriptional regulator with XRE-family HTH domain
VVITLGETLISVCQQALADEDEAVELSSNSHPVMFTRAKKLRDAMDIGARLQALRRAKRLSQDDTEYRTGLARTFISRVENGHASPTLKTLGKLARGLKVPLWQLFYGNDSPPAEFAPSQWERVEDLIADSSVRNAAYLVKLRRFTRRMDEANRRLLLGLAQKMAKQGGKRGR